MTQTILAFGVHPDDIELGCAGTLIKHREKGYKVVLCDLTQGELGTRGSAELRVQEAEAAREVIGAQAREQLAIQDGYFQHTQENIDKIIRVVRKRQPDIVLANAPTDRHPDHGRAAKLVADACFLAGLEKIETGQEKRRPQAVYHYVQDHYLEVDFAVDITDQMKQKKQAIACFVSQFHDPDSSESETPISSAEFLESVRAKNAVYGRAIGVQYAEGFISSTPLRIDQLGDLC